MNRLKYSDKGFMRSNEISSKQIFVFVEGKSIDRYFYDKILEKSIENTKLEYKIIKIDTVNTQSSGGKNSIKSYFYKIKRRGCLYYEFKDKKIFHIFILDKDIDDILNKKLKSKHIVYTKYYNVENYVFKYGRLNDYIGAALSLDKKTVSLLPISKEKWRENSIESWEKWIVLALIAVKLKINNCDCTFGNNSQIKIEFNGNVIESELNKRRNLLQINSTLNDIKFDKYYRKIEKFVQKMFIEGNHDMIFNGKFYKGFIKSDLEKLKLEFDYNLNGLHNVITSTMLYSLNFNDNWSDHLIIAVKNIID